MLGGGGLRLGGVDSCLHAIKRWSACSNQRIKHHLLTSTGLLLRNLIKFTILGEAY